MPEQRPSPNYEAETLRQLHSLIEENHALGKVVEDYYRAISSLFLCLSQGKDPFECVTALQGLQVRALLVIPSLREESTT